VSRLTLRCVDIWDYFDRKQREFAAASAYPDRPPLFEEEPGSDGTVGRVLAFLGLTEDAYMKVYERVVIRDGVPHREVYSYSLIVEESFLHGWERDPRNHPECPVHEHGPEPQRERRATEPVTLPQALEQSWDELSLRAEAPP